MIGVELEAQRSYPVEFARGIMSALGGERGPAAIAASQNIAEILIQHMHMLRGKPWY